MTDTALAVAPTDQAMPKAVWASLAMMLVQVPIGLISVLFFQPIEIGFFSLVLIVIANIAVLGLIALLFFGYGWVRHLYVAGAILVLPQLVLTLVQRAHSSPMNAVWVLVTNLWFYAALGLLYLPSARTWFREARMRRRGGL